MDFGTHPDSPQDNPTNGSTSRNSGQQNVLPRSSRRTSLSQDTHTSNDGSSSSKRSKARYLAEAENMLSKEGKIRIRLNDDLQPDSPAWAVTQLSNQAASLARRDIKVIYSDFRLVPPGEYGKVIENLNANFEFENWEGVGVECRYVREKINDAWKRRKYYLKKKYVDGKDPNVLKAMAPPCKLPVEDWRVFIDNCNTETMQELSEQNRENRMMQEFPNCSGRTPAQVVRLRIAEELGIDVSQVGRGYTYLAMHTHPDNTFQNPQVAGAIQSSMSSNPDSQTTCNDAVAEVLGPDTRGRYRAGGSGTSKTQMK